MKSPRRKRKRRETRFYDDANVNTGSLACHYCPVFALCGGLHRAAGAFSCLDDCCGGKPDCDKVCITRPKQFVTHVREVGGLELDRTPRAPRLPFPVLPASVPLLYGRSGRTSRFAPEAVALSLHQVFDRRTGALRFTDREQLCKRFLIHPDSQIVLSGTDRDKSVERWWELGERRIAILEGLRRLGIAGATVPNFSLFNDVVRFDNLHAMKRITLAWQEMTAVGIPTALHVNGRTETDFRNWREFVASRPEVTTIAYEFATGAAGHRRMGFHVDELCHLAEEVQRPLGLVIRGGVTALDRLRSSFTGSIAVIDTTSYMKTVYRQSARQHSSGLTWRTVKTKPEEPLDDLLWRNHVTFSRFIRMRLGLQPDAVPSVEHGQETPRQGVPPVTKVS